MSDNGVIMDRRRTDEDRTRRCGNNSYNNVMELEYDVVTDNVPKVDILPADPINEEREYADRDLPRSPWAPSLTSLSAGNSNATPRNIPLTPGPAVNRELKRCRRTTRLDKGSTPHQPEEPLSYRCSPPPLPLTLDLERHLPALTLQEPCSKDAQRVTIKEPGFRPHTKGLQSAESCASPCNKQSHLLDLDGHQTENRSQQSPESVPSKPHRESCRTADDVDLQFSDPMEKPQQTYCEEDWYIGPCDRADAEHALHLVNKDGAFLVRDCSSNASGEPLVLAVYHDKKVYNVKIRLVELTNKYTLGARQRRDMFDSVADIIKFHSIFPIVISGRYMPGGRRQRNCVLTCPVTRRDVDRLLQ